MNDGQGWFLEKQQQITERVGEPVLLVVKMTFETATFHVLTPYPGTALYRRLADQGRILHDNWDLYDTRHAVFRPAQMTGEVLERGYWQAYREFYRWGSIVRGARTKPTWTSRLRHVAYAAAGRSLSRCGIGSSARAGSAGCCRCWKPFCAETAGETAGAWTSRPGIVAQSA